MNYDGENSVKQLKEGTPIPPATVPIIHRGRENEAQPLNQLTGFLNAENDVDLIAPHQSNLVDRGRVKDEANIENLVLESTKRRRIS